MVKVLFVNVGIPQMYSRNFILIILSSIVLGAPMPVLILLGALAGQELAPSAGLVTLPLSVQMLAGIIVAMPISIYMGKAGRRNGFMLGALCMIAGGCLAAWAMAQHSFLLLCTAHLIFGAAFISFNFFRFAAAESVAEPLRAPAIAYTLASGLVAALVGPFIYIYFKDALVVPFAGAYLALAGLGLLGCLPLSRLSRMLPPKTDLAENNRTAAVPGRRQLLSRPIVIVAIVSAAIAQAAMVLLMVPTPLAMEAFGHEGHHGADVIRWHVIAMFAPGFFTGALIQRFGTLRIIATGFVLLIAAAFVAAQGIALIHFYLSLALLGVGWNFGFIGGTFLLQSSLSQSERPMVQGFNDMLIAIASSVASLSSGVLYAGFGWSMLAITTAIAIIIALIAIVVGNRSMMNHKTGMGT